MTAGRDVTADAHPVPDATVQAEWDVRYQEYLSRTVQRVERVREAHRDVVEEIAAGRLAPAALDYQLASFAQTHLSEYADSLADISTRFLTGLVEFGAAYTHDLIGTILPPDAVGEATPPPLEAGDALDWLQRLAAHAAAQQRTTADMLRAVMSRVAAGELTPGLVEGHAPERPGPQPGVSVGRLVGMYFDLLAELEGVNARFEEQYLTAVLGLARGPATAVDVTGVVGATELLRLEVANTSTEAAAVRCALTDVRRADGVGPAFASQATIRPDRFELAPGAERTIAVAVPLAEGTYEPGVAYVATLKVLGPSETLLELALRIAVTAPSPVTAAAGAEA